MEIYLQQDGSLEVHTNVALLTSSRLRSYAIHDVIGNWDYSMCDVSLV